MRNNQNDYLCQMKFRQLHKISVVFLTFSVFSCGNYQKVYKSDDLKAKYELAEELFKNGDYIRSERLFSQIVDNHTGKPSGERVIYMLAQGFFNREKYESASVYFEKFMLNYPKSEKYEEVMFLDAMCYFHQVPKYSLDQNQTYRAIDKFQLFIDRYPNTEYLQKANEIVLKLVTQLQKKSFEIAKGYNKIKDYKAAMKSLDNFLIENPGSVFKEEALYYRLNSAYQMAINSIESKEQERLKEALQAYENLMKDFPETKYKVQAEKMYKQIVKKISK